jgi:hypothetical protein
MGTFLKIPANTGFFVTNIFSPPNNGAAQGKTSRKICRGKAEKVVVGCE